MPRSVFSKIYVSSILILLITVFVTSGMLLYMTKEYITGNEESSAMSSAKDISGLIRYRSPSSDQLFNRMIASYANKLNATVFICDTSGRVLISSGSVSGTLNKYVPAGYQLSENQYKKVIGGKSINEHGNFDGYFDKDVVIAAVPLNIDGVIVGAVFVCKALPNTDDLIGDMRKYFLFSVIISLIFASLIMYLTAKRITAPIKKMKSAAKDFAAGKFETRTGITGRGEIAELAAEFDIMADSLENLEQNRRSFIADVSHELRTPMTTITGFIEGMLDGTIPPENRDRYLTVVLEETKRLTRLVNDLLYAEKYRRNEVVLTKSDFDINEVIRLVLISFEQRITAKSIEAEVIFNYESELVYADRDSIQRVITNLIDNAIKFTPEGGRITISTDSSGGKCRISVFNSGSFISSEDRNKIFDRFYKTDKSRGIDKTGVGLGLHIVKSILSEHSSIINVKSDEKGTEFSFTLSSAKNNI